MNISSVKFRVIFCALLITAAIWGTGIYIPPYQVEQPIMFATEFPGDAANWLVDTEAHGVVNDTSVTLRANPERRTRLLSSCPPVSDAIKLRKMRISGFGQLEKPGTIVNKTSALAFWFINNDNKIIRYHNIHVQPGRYEASLNYKVVKWPKGATGCVFALITNAGGPTISVSNGQVDSVVDNINYLVAIALTGFLVFLVTVYLLILASKNLSVLQLLFPALLVIGLMLGITVSGQLLVDYVNPMLNWVLTKAGVDLTASGGNRASLAWLFKVGHGVMFFAIALYFYWMSRSINASLSVICFVLIVLAVASEGVQLHFYDRGASVLDILFDWAGILLALLIYLGIRTLRELR